jgi:hypothetical protein
MHGRPDRHAGQAFPFTPAGPPVSSRTRDPRGAIVTEQPVPYSATVRLRGRGGPLPVGVFWPPDQRQHRRLLLALNADPERARALCARTGRVVLAAAQDHPLTLDDLEDLLAWAAEHAAELGARPDDVLVTGAGPGAAVAELRRWSGVEGWPRLAVLDDPDS